MLDVPRGLTQYVSRLLHQERQARGTRKGVRALTCFKQALFVLAWFRDRPDIARLGHGFGISQATAYRYLHEGITVLSRQAPDLQAALERAVEEGWEYLILDGTIIETDRVRQRTVNRRGETIPAWYCASKKRFGGNVQALMRPDGLPLWISEVLVGVTHDLTAARIFALADIQSYVNDRRILADPAYQGAGQGILTPVKKPNNGQELDLNARTYNRLLRGLRSIGERGFALLKQRWATLQHVMIGPEKIGAIAKAALVLTHYEHKYLT